MSDCQDYGTAVIQTTPDGPRWMHSDAHIHVAPELLNNPEAVAFIESRYRIGEACPTSDTIHAHLAHEESA
jgi:hypothetical protein